MAWAHNFKPPKAAGHGGPANGSSIVPRAGGPATGKTKKAFEPGNKAAVGRPDAGEGYRAVTEKEKAAQLRDHLYMLALSAEHEMTQVRATEAYLNRVEGLPVARNINLAVNDLSQLDDDALARQQQELERAIRAASAGATQADDTQEP